MEIVKESIVAGGYGGGRSVWGAQRMFRAGKLFSRALYGGHVTLGICQSRE